MTPTELKNRRIELGLTQQALADVLGVSRLTVIHWEQGKAKFPAYLQFALDHLAGLSR